MRSSSGPRYETLGRGRPIQPGSSRPATSNPHSSVWAYQQPDFIHPDFAPYEETFRELPDPQNPSQMVLIKERRHAPEGSLARQHDESVKRFGMGLTFAKQHSQDPCPEGWEDYYGPPARSEYRDDGSWMDPAVPPASGSVRSVRSVRSAYCKRSHQDEGMLYTAETRGSRRWMGDSPSFRDPQYHADESPDTNDHPNQSRSTDQRMISIADGGYVQPYHSKPGGAHLPTRVKLSSLSERNGKKVKFDPSWTNRKTRKYAVNPTKIGLVV